MASSSPKLKLGRGKRGKSARIPALSLRPKPETIEPLRVKADARFSYRCLDPDAVKVIRRLNAHDYTAYLVGGCVRDLSFQVEPKDYDIATEATPRQIKRLFRNSRIIGRRFRLVHVTFGPKVLDVSTFRAQVDSSDADPMIRHDNVFGTAGEDAMRRDFTINGLFYDLRSGELIDYVGGLRDLERKVLETIGDPWVRFREDPVRMLRAIKFAGRLGLRLADDVYQAMLDCRSDLEKAAAPRLLEEIIRLLNRGGACAATRLLYKTGIMHLLLPAVAEDVDRALAAGIESPMWQYLERIDELVRSGEQVHHVVMLGCLFLNIFDEAVYGDTPQGGVRDLNQLAERTLRPVASRLHMSRRDVYRLKQMLVAQRRLAGLPKTKRRRGSSSQFVTREYFHDSWVLFRICGEITGRFAEEREEWAERIESAHSGRRGRGARAF